MNSCKITIQRNVGEQWPVVLEQKAAEGSLEFRSEGLLSLDLQALASQLLPHDYGVMLGQALFQGAVRDAFLHARAQSEDRLSVQLFVEAPDLRALRWERLCAPFDEQWHFLMLDQRTPFTLALPSKADRRFPPIERKDLRALVVVACPEGLERYQLSPFPVEETVAGIRTALGDIPYDVLANLPDAAGPPTLDALCERLTTMSYPLLHIVCHGQYIAAIDDTVFYLCKEDQQVDPVVSSRLLERLSQIRGERGLSHFAFLATCESASPQAEGALGGLAQRLVRDVGIPAVLAMTDTVTISTAEALTSTFYRHLSVHGHLDLALSEACAGLAERPDCTVASLYSRLGAQPLFAQAVVASPASQQPPLTLSQQEQKRNRTRMLERVQRIWISGVLEQSLHGVALLSLGLQEQPNAVTDPWRLVMQEAERPARSLPPGTRITQVYDDADHELLILGAPGAGKTTLLLELTRDLLQRAKQDDTHPIPVVFNLSSWAVKRQPLKQWLAEELNLKYQVPDKLAQAWVETDQVLPLLDGLDEVAAEQRTACTGAINQYRSERGLVPLVISSRSAEYFAQTTLLLLNRAVLVQPLTTQQIEGYLARAERQLASVHVALQADPALHELATTPLMLSVLTLTYQGRSAEELPVAGPPEIRREHIFASYVERMLQRRGVSYYTPDQTKYWLAWLARQMVQHGQTEFYLERMQPDWLEEHQSLRHTYRAAVRLGSGLVGGLSTGLLLGLVSGLFGWLNTGQSSGLVVGLLSGLVGGLLVGLTHRVGKEIKPAEIVIWSWKSMWQKLAKMESLRSGLFFGLFFGLVVGLLVGLFFGLFSGLGTGLVGGLFGGLLVGLVSRTVSELLGGTQDKQAPPSPSQEIKYSARNRILVGLVGGVVSGVVGGVVGGLVFGVVGGVVDLLVDVLDGVLVFGLFFGLFGGLIIALIHPVRKEVKPREIISWLRASIWRELMKSESLKDMLVNGLSTGLFFGQVLGLYLGLYFGLFGWLISGFIFEFMSGLIGGLSSDQLDSHILTKPNQGIQRSTQNSIVVGLTGVLFGGLFGGLAFGLFGRLFFGLFGGLVIGSISGLSIGLSNGGAASIQHAVLQMFLWRAGYAPWNYSRFLDYAAERILLRKVGGGYIFVHRLLLEYFASLDTAATPDATKVEKGQEELAS